MKMDIKHGNDEFLVRTLKHVLGLTSHENPLETPNLWEIAHENGHRTRKSQVFGHHSQTCIGPYGRCKSSRTPKQWGITHENGHQTQKYDVLFITLKYIPSLAGHANPPRTPNLWAIAQQTAINHEND